MEDQIGLPGLEGAAPAQDADRARYLDRLREHLKDPAFRAIEGFPIGTDEAILALSDPPYYTACPNPFLPEILEAWRQERAATRARLGLPDDSAENGRSTYYREPFAADVSEGKGDPIYNAHSYHTKVPHKAIMRYILHYTDPGDVVFDGFCGTGMTGVAAQLCGDRKAVESLGYRVDAAGVVYDGDAAIWRLGGRKAALVDLSPAATFIAYNYNTPVEVAAFEREAKRILREVEAECGWMYETWHPNCDSKARATGRIEFTIWSDVFACPHCAAEMVFWDVAVNRDISAILDTFACPKCGAQHSKSSVERLWQSVFDPGLNRVVRRARQVPALIYYTVGSKRFEKVPDAEDLRLLARIEQLTVRFTYPTDELPKGDKMSDPVNVGITHVHQFFTPRNLQVLACLWAAANDQAIQFVVSALMPRASRMHRIAGSRVGKVKRTAGGMTIGIVSGTLYVPAISAEMNILKQFADRLALVAATKAQLPPGHTTVAATTSASQLEGVSADSLDYVFVDPPFGMNLMYSELNLIWESWLRVRTNNLTEAVMSACQLKGLAQYQQLMTDSIQEFYRILKPGRWLTVEFHNSQNSVWNAIQEAVLRAGFVVADVRTFDKQQGSFNQYNSRGAVKQDLIISAYKPRASFEQRFVEEAGTPEGAWDFVRQHLAQLPIVVESKGRIERVAERQGYLLFDRMVAFHIQRGATIPLSAAELYAGLRQRFVERDGMYFLPEQQPEYDRARLKAEGVEQLSLFVTDEKSTIQWLRQQLDPALGGKPQSYQDLLPLFLRELHQARHESLPELGEVLAQGFLQDALDRWYVPDPDKATDLERLRERALLREHHGYLEGRGRLRQFRTEAVRAGFADAWRRQDFAAILKVAERLPESALQEDQDLLMYYDNASLRA